MYNPDFGPSEQNFECILMDGTNCIIMVWAFKMFYEISVRLIRRQTKTNVRL